MIPIEWLMKRFVLEMFAFSWDVPWDTAMTVLNNQHT